MFQRFDSLYELKKCLALENFESLSPESDYKCKYCGLDLYEVLYKDQLNKYVRCHICNALWILPQGSYKLAR